MERYLYLVVDVFSVLIPFAFSFHPKLQFAHYWKSFWPSCLAVAFAFIVWDLFFTNMGVWGFNPRYLIGIQIGNLPLEEILFFICIPYASVFTYHCLSVLIQKEGFANYENKISFLLSMVLLVLGAFNTNRWYTCSTFFLCGAFLLLHVLVLRLRWMSRFYFCYMAILPFFFLTNGTLTGGFTEQPVVWYNNAENLGIRLFSIPLEDVFYGFLLLALNVGAFEKLKAYHSKTQVAYASTL